MGSYHSRYRNSSSNFSKGQTRNQKSKQFSRFTTNFKCGIFSLGYKTAFIRNIETLWQKYFIVFDITIQVFRIVERTFLLKTSSNYMISISKSSTFIGTKAHIITSNISFKDCSLSAKGYLLQNDSQFMTNTIRYGQYLIQVILSS